MVEYRIPDEPYRIEMECPYCKEVIKVGAIKCKHCGEKIDEMQGPVKENVDRYINNQKKTEIEIKNLIFRRDQTNDLVQKNFYNNKISQLLDENEQFVDDINNKQTDLYSRGLNNKPLSSYTKWICIISFCIAAISGYSGILVITQISIAIFIVTLLRLFFYQMQLHAPLEIVKGLFAVRKLYFIGFFIFVAIVIGAQVIKGTSSYSNYGTKIIYLDSPMQNVPNVTFYKDSSSDQISRSAQQLFDMGAKMRDQELKRHEIDSYSRALQNMDFGSSSRTTCTWVGNYLNCW